MTLNQLLNCLSVSHDIRCLRFYKNLSRSLGFHAYQLTAGVTLPTEGKEFLPVLPACLDPFECYSVLRVILSIVKIGAVKTIPYIGMSMYCCSYCLHLLLKLGDIFDKRFVRSAEEN